MPWARSAPTTPPTVVTKDESSAATRAPADGQRCGRGASWKEYTARGVAAISAPSAASTARRGLLSCRSSGATRRTSAASGRCVPCAVVNEPVVLPQNARPQPRVRLPLQVLPEHFYPHIDRLGHGIGGVRDYSVVQLVVQLGELGPDLGLVPAGDSQALAVRAGLETDHATPATWAMPVGLRVAALP